ncbi:MAG: preprotein translocase subunit SecE [Clostridia bacterium]|nr:preprotein translocase subunit SecE [Clostridia bacterium]
MSEKNVKTTETKPQKKDKNAKPNFFVRIGRWFKNTFSGMFAELKKVTWPKFSTVVKQTGVVLGVVLFFMVIVTLLNLGLSELMNLLTSNL